MLITSAQEFLVRFDETIRWCIPRIDKRHAKTCLRSEALREVIALHGTDFDPLWVTAAMVEDLTTMRSRLLSWPRPVARMTSGSLLVCLPECTNHNGLAEDCSQGYVDFYDQPPWDTWIGVIAPDPVPGHPLGGLSLPPGPQPDQTGGDHEPLVLISWVPPEFSDLAYEAVGVECSRMLFWASSECSPSRREQEFDPVLPMWFHQLFHELDAW